MFPHSRSKRPNRRYTVDTLAHFASEYGASADLFFVMGADSWAEITTWREWERLLTIVNHIVVTRPGYEVKFGTGQCTSCPSEVVDVRGVAAGQIPTVGEKRLVKYLLPMP